MVVRTLSKPKQKPKAFHYAAVTGKGKMPSNEAEAQINDWMQLFPIDYIFNDNQRG
jgi:hypothetical protein